MLLQSEAVQTSRRIEKKNLEERIVKEGLELLKKQKEEAKRRKAKEQQEMKEMLERYWPWERAADSRPRGMKNLRLEELFPNFEYQNAKRHVGLMELGRSSGCGAPLIRDGQKITKTKEDPLLRFQLGSKDLRNAVENSYQYKKTKEEQMLYKKELDKLVEEKKLKKLKEKLENAEFEKRQFSKTPPWGKKGPGGAPWRSPCSVGIGFLKSLGWSNEQTLREIEAKAQSSTRQKSKVISSSNRPIKLNPVIQPSPSKDFVAPARNPKFSPLSSNNNNNNKENGPEFVNILPKDRRRRHIIIENKPKFGERENSSNYLKELTDQMLNKRQEIQKIKEMDMESSRRHFSTLESFWGKPGHGARRSETKKHSIERLLNPPQNFPIGVA